MCSAIAQPVERLPVKEDVPGSIPGRGAQQLFLFLSLRILPAEQIFQFEIYEIDKLCTHGKLDLEKTKTPMDLHYQVLNGSDVFVVFRKNARGVSLGLADYCPGRQKKWPFTFRRPLLIGRAFREKPTLQACIVNKITPGTRVSGPNDFLIATEFHR